MYVYYDSEYDSKQAITKFKLIETNETMEQPASLGLYEAEIITGRTHQLRIHFNDSGAPIKGDPYYNSNCHQFLSPSNLDQIKMYLQVGFKNKLLYI